MEDTDWLTLVEFKAGRTFIQGKRVTPLDDKGSFSISLNMMDHSFRLKWVNRMDKHQFMTYPLDNSTVVKWARKESRIFLVEKGDQKFFFWMQEPTSENDSNYVDAVVKLLSNPSHALFPSVVNQEAVAVMQSLLSLDQEAEVAPAPHPAPDPAHPNPPQPDAARQEGAGQLDLNRILHAMGFGARPDPYHLRDFVNTETVLPVLQNSDASEHLLSLLPEPYRHPGGVRELVSSPQFSEAVRVLTSILKTHHQSLQGFYASFGLPPPPPKTQGVDALLQSLLLYAQRNPHGK
mmetsp:Transcript_44798/g.112927  ORF Transcript_44798/g.112927 Transcript_44798/m.112927 type:complete len:292 (-) Transcript_44798:211-1086(-)